MDIYEQILHCYRVDEMSLRAIALKLGVVSGKDAQ